MSKKVGLKYLILICAVSAFGQKLPKCEAYYPQYCSAGKCEPLQCEFPTPPLMARRKSMAKKWRILYNALPADRRKGIESWVNGFRARVNGESLNSGIADHDWADGWAEADETLLGKWAMENNIGTKVEPR